jgi:hypothetical protein
MLQNESKELEHKKIIPISENYYYWLKIDSILKTIGLNYYKMNNLNLVWSFTHIGMIITFMNMKMSGLLFDCVLIPELWFTNPLTIGITYVTN